VSRRTRARIAATLQSVAKLIPIVLPLVAGGVVLYGGADDFPFLEILPFIDRMQVFRSSYFLELFAFGLAGLGLTTPLRGIVALGSAVGPRPMRVR